MTWTFPVFKLQLEVCLRSYPTSPNYPKQLPDALFPFIICGSEEDRGMTYTVMRQLELEHCKQAQGPRGASSRGPYPNVIGQVHELQIFGPRTTVGQCVGTAENKLLVGLSVSRERAKQDHIIRSKDYTKLIGHGALDVLLSAGRPTKLRIGKWGSLEVFCSGSEGPDW